MSGHGHKVKTYVFADTAKQQRGQGQEANTK